ncbi:MAG: DUF763 domain-containing protein [Bacteroidales bacterium]
MKKSGSADLPLHTGRVPPWLYERMTKIGKAIAEAIIEEFGTSEFLSRISDPHWFQSLGAVMGMDWHSSGITTSVLGALKKAINPLSHEYGIYVCGGRGKHSRQTPKELIEIANTYNLNGNKLVKSSKLSAKIDNTALQDNYQLYLHNFILNNKGEWAVVQQGMNAENRMARRYHWHSPMIKSFVEEPHKAVCGKNHGLILNLAAKEAGIARDGIMEITKEKPWKMMEEVKKLTMPTHHKVLYTDIDLKRLGSVLTLAYEGACKDFENLLLVHGLGPKTLRSLTLISEIIYGTPSRFTDPARFSFANGGKDGAPFPVQTSVYDDTIQQLEKLLTRAKLGYTDKKTAFKNLSKATISIEKKFQPNPIQYEQFLENEKKESWKHGGRTAFGKSLPPKNENSGPKQLKLF